ncbi:hypothetical protein K502DRAFT_324290 [Neoconidiobolus thromboides FSU 785]|nr:hypothetical protein K502DRAFT_324290 [Neoconidiobolus thromboides FSU 785]
MYNITSNVNVTFLNNKVHPFKSRIALLRNEDVKIERALIIDAPSARSLSVGSGLVLPSTNSPLSCKTVKRSDLPPHLKRRSYELEIDSSDEEELPEMRGLAARYNEPNQKLRRISGFGLPNYNISC